MKNELQSERHIGLVGEAFVCDGRLDEDTVDVLVVPDGDVRSKSGNFRVDGESWALIEQAFKQLGRDLPVDYEHQTLGGNYASPTGLAPAAGWVKSLRYEPGRGIIAAVKWTDRARTMIRAGEYRYPSPVLLTRKEDRKAVELHSVAMTNVPAIEGIEALAAKQTTGKEIKVMAEEPTTGAPTDQDKVLLLLGQVIKEFDLQIEGDVGPVAVLEALLAKGGKSEGEGEGGEGGGEETVASKAVLNALGVKDDASESEVIVAVNTLKQGSESLATLKTKLDAVEKTLAEREADEALRPHVEAGRINPNDKEDMKVCKALAISDRKAFDHQMAHRQPDPPPGRTQAPPGGASDSREMIIAKAAREFDADPKLERLTSKAAYVGGILRDNGKSALTDEERKTVVA